MNKPKLQAVEDRVYGTFFWEGPGGKLLSDGEGRFLTMPGKKGDIVAMAKMKQVATDLGFGEGKCVWKPGIRPITDNEYDLMMERLEEGKTPDPADEYLDAIENLKTRKAEDG